MRKRFISFELKRGRHVIGVRRNPIPLKGYIGFVDGVAVATGSQPHEALRLALAFRSEAAENEAVIGSENEEDAYEEAAS